MSAPLSRPPAVLAAVLLGGWAAASLLVNLPPYADALFGPFHLALSLEAAIGIGLLAAARAVGPRTARAAAGLLAAAFVLLVALRAADLTARSIVDRPLNLFLDLSLLPAVADVATTLMGGPLALAAAAGALLGLGLLLALAAAALARLAPMLAAPGARGLALGVAAGAVAVFAAQTLALAQAPGWRPLSASASRLVAEQALQAQAALVRRAAFRASLAQDPASAIPDEALFARLAGLDVLLVFVESYGVSAIDDPRYAPVVRESLARMGEGAAAGGFAVASGRLVAASAGGQSWLNHASVDAGRRIDDQTLYALYLDERPPGLVQDFARTGRRTVQLKPAITLPWPEGLRLGYDATYEAKDFGYRGPLFYWGVVPDQFALHVLAARELDPSPRGPVFAMAALISSHAPWLPVPEVVPWDALGDGAVFSRFTEGAPEPREVWRDPERVRAAYARSVAHSLDVIGAFLAERMPGDALAIVMGDHQPAPLITGPRASRAVPVHVFARDAGLLAPFAALGFVEGIEPGPAPAAGDAALPRIDELRGFLLEAFSEAARFARADAP